MKKTSIYIYVTYLVKTIIIEYLISYIKCLLTYFCFCLEFGSSGFNNLRFSLPLKNKDWNHVIIPQLITKKKNRYLLNLFALFSGWLFELFHNAFFLLSIKALAHWSLASYRIYLVHLFPPYLTYSKSSKVQEQKIHD